MTLKFSSLGFIEPVPATAYSGQLISGLPITELLAVFTIETFAYPVCGYRQSISSPPPSPSFFPGHGDKLHLPRSGGGAWELVYSQQ